MELTSRSNIFNIVTTKVYTVLILIETKKVYRSGNSKAVLIPASTFKAMERPDKVSVAFNEVMIVFNEDMDIEMIKSDILNLLKSIELRYGKVT